MVAGSELFLVPVYLVWQLGCLVFRLHVIQVLIGTVGNVVVVGFSNTYGTFKDRQASPYR